MPEASIVTRLLCRLAAGIALLLLTSSAIAASQTESGHSASEAHGTPHHTHHLALFLGGTDGKDDIGVGFTVGLDYERRLNEWLGVVALCDYAARPLDETVLGAGLMVHPVAGLAFAVAPGVVFEKEHGGHGGETRSDSGHEEPSGTKAELMIRVGVMYQIRIGERFSLAPQLNLDLLGRDTVPVFGISAGYGF